MMNIEELDQTLVLIKPDALKNSLTGYILSQLSEFNTGLCLAAAKIVQVSRMLAEEHYSEHRGKGFYSSLIEYIRGHLHFPDDPGKRWIIAFIFQGQGAIKKIRELAGPTNPHNARDSKPGCIRALGTIVPLKDEAGNFIGDRMDNLIHASANPADAEREIKLWFRPVDIPPLMRLYPTAKCQEHYYFKDNQLLSAYESGSLLLAAPGDIVWQSDLEALQLLNKGLPAPCSLQAIAAKYLINQSAEND